MEVNFDIANAQPRDISNLLHELAVVLLLRIKEAILRAPARSIAWSVVGDSRPPFTPLGHTPQRGFSRRAHPERFIVIRYCEPDTLRRARPNFPAPPVFQIWPKPYLSMPWKLHSRPSP